MGNAQDGPRMKIGKVLTAANITELSSLSGFTPDQVREWHTGFLVSGIFPLSSPNWWESRNVLVSMFSNCVEILSSVLSGSEGEKRDVIIDWIALDRVTWNASHPWTSSVHNQTRSSVSLWQGIHANYPSLSQERWAKLASTTASFSSLCVCSIAAISMHERYVSGSNDWSN